MAAGGQAEADLPEIFKAFASYNDPKSNGTVISLVNSEKWLKQAKIIGPKITATDAGVAFKKYKKPGLDYASFLTFLDDLAKSKKLNLNEIKTKLGSVERPQPASAKPSISGPVSGTLTRMSDIPKGAGVKKRVESPAKRRNSESRKSVARDDDTESKKEQKK